MKRISLLLLVMTCCFELQSGRTRQCASKSFIGRSNQLSLEQLKALERYQTEMGKRLERFDEGLVFRGILQARNVVRQLEKQEKAENFPVALIPLWFLQKEQMEKAKAAQAQKAEYKGQTREYTKRVSSNQRQVSHKPVQRRGR